MGGDVMFQEPINGKRAHDEYEGVISVRGIGTVY